MPTKVVIIGGSVGGVSTAVALRKAGCDVTVLERAASIVATTGAGLGLDPETCAALTRLGLRDIFEECSQPIPIEEYRWIDHASKSAISLIKNDKHLHRSMHWRDLHRLLIKALPEGAVNFSHKVALLQQSESGVTVTAETPSGDKKYHGDIVIAADGVGSFARKQLVPGDERRYAGMVAWRGVCDGNAHPELLAELKGDFETLGNGIIFDIADRCMNLIYMIPGNRINWLWYRDAPEPKLGSHSVTIRPDAQDMQKLYRDAENTWTPAFVKLIKTSKAPFMNVIYDKDPITQWVFGRVALMGEAAHPTTPHGSRSTNMSLQDADCLGRCFEAQPHDPVAALHKYAEERIPQTTKEVLFSRHVGEVRQGHWFDPVKFDWPSQTPEIKSLLLNGKQTEPDYKKCATELLGNIQTIGKGQSVLATDREQ